MKAKYYSILQDGSTDTRVDGASVNLGVHKGMAILLRDTSP